MTLGKNLDLILCYSKIDSLATNSNVRTGLIVNSNIEMDYSTERSPLLLRAQPQRTDANSCKILFLAIIFILGTAIGVYLLLEDCKEISIK